MTTPPVGSLGGRVYFALSQEPIQDVMVACAQETIYTNATGRFYFEKLRQGERWLTAHKADFQSYTRSVDVGESGTISVYLEPSDTTSNLAGVVSHRLEGNITLASVDVPGYSATTNRQGEFVLADVPHGNYDLTVTRAGYDVYRKHITLYKWDQVMEVILTIPITEISYNLRDTYITFRYAETVEANFGDSARVKVGPVEKAYGLIQLPQDPNPIDWAELGAAIVQLYCLRSNSDKNTDWSVCFDVTQVVGDWSENNVNWLNKPTFGAVVQSFSGEDCVPDIPEMGIWLEFDATAELEAIWRGYHNRGFCLQYDLYSDLGFQFVSSEAPETHLRPRLVYTYHY
ncbi:MAG: DNRLRE domain-containing protein [bacterium]